MSGEKEVTGKFKYEQDSNRYHRFRIDTDASIVGTNQLFIILILPFKVAIK